MKCLGFITPDTLAKEAGKYGVAGHWPQVIWPNGILASSAVGLAVDSLTGWSGKLRAPVYLSYDGNTGLIKDHVRLEYSSKNCLHYPVANAGSPIIKPL